MSNITIFLATIIVLCLWRIKFVKPVFRGINGSYLEMGRTNAIKGLFVLLVFLSHVRNYISMLPQYSSDPLNSFYNIF